MLDAHNQGLEIYASDFANDASIAYNYSYDPVSEYLSFIDNGVFSVDGVLTDFPITPSEARGNYSCYCYSHLIEYKPYVCCFYAACHTRVSTPLHFKIMQSDH